MTDRYPLRPFRIQNDEALFRIIEEYPLATVISADAKPDNISLIPLMRGDPVTSCRTLIGHVDANNPHAAQLTPGNAVSFVFQGPQSYASPDIYPDKQLPGWLYVAVKGAGTVTRTIAGAGAIEMLCEASHRLGGPKQHFQLDMDDPRFDLLLGGIVGFEISIDRMSGIAKLAQDKGPEHSKLACAFLSERDSNNRSEFLQMLRDATD